jgi:hypothetical protein
LASRIVAFPILVIVSMVCGPAARGSVTLRSAIGAYTDEFDAPLEYLVPRVLEQLHVAPGHGRIGGEIIDPPASGASDVLVNIEIAVEPLLHTADLQFSDYTPSGEKFQVSIDRAEADMGQLPSHDLVQFVSRGVRMELSQLIDYYFSLLC